MMRVMRCMIQDSQPIEEFTTPELVCSSVLELTGRITDGIRLILSIWRIFGEEINPKSLQ